MAKKPAESRALAYLRGLIADASEAGGASPRLPTVKALAADAGVAGATMWKAVRRLCDEGILQASPRSGIRVLRSDVDMPDTEPSPLPMGRKWQRLCGTIERDVLNGVYPPGSELPAGKALCHRYGVCFQTMRKALLWLVDRGILTADRKRYVVPRVDTARSQATVAFVSWVVGTEVLSTLDSECSKAGVRMRVLTLFPHDELLEQLRRMRQGLTGDALLGYLVSITGGSAEQYREILSILAPSDLPIAVLDQTGGATGVHLPGGRALRVFTIANSPQPGEDVGRYLLGLGHRRVAYFSPSHGDIWSQRRLSGLQNVFARAGDGAAVAPCTCTGRPRSSHIDYQEELRTLATRMKASSARPTRLVGKAIERREDQLLDAVQWADTEEALRPLMDTALADRGITAWVGCNDSVAIMCRDYLWSRHVRIPEDISLVGFDDRMEAFAADLTSYNFNRTAATHAVLAYLIGGHHADIGQPGQAIEIQGFVSPRGSTGPVRKEMRVQADRGKDE